VHVHCVVIDKLPFPIISRTASMFAPSRTRYDANPCLNAWKLHVGEIPSRSWRALARQLEEIDSDCDDDIEADEDDGDVPDDSDDE